MAELTPEQRRTLLAAQMRAAERRRAARDDRNPDGTYGKPPEGMVFNPETGQYTDRELLKGNMDSSTAGAAGRGVLGGMMLNFDDEVRAAGKATRGLLTGQEGLGEFELERARAQQEVDAEESGIARTAGVVGGGMLPALATAPYATGPTLAGTMGRGLGLGGLEGAAFGAGRGEGIDRGRAAAMDGTIGGLLGVAAPAVVQGARGVYRGIRNAATGTANPQAGAQAVADTVRQSGRAPAEIAGELSEAAADGQPEFRLMDALGTAGQRRVSGIVRAGDDEAAEQLSNYLETRQLGQPERVSQFTDEAFGMQGRTAEQTRAALEGARDEAADAAYSAARSNAAPVNLGNTIEAIDDALRGVNSLDGGQTALRETAIGRNLDRIRNQLQSGSYSTIDFDEVLETKQELGRAITSIRRRGEKVPPKVASVFGALDEALEEASPSYRQANDGFRQASGVIDAVDQGASATSPRQRAADTLDQFNGMTPEQQAAARVGYGDRMLGKVESNAAPTSNRARIFRSPKVAAEVEGIAIDPETFGRRLTREDAMWQTQNRALQGSRTADNLRDISAAEGPTRGLLGAIRSPVDAAARGLDALSFVMRGENAPTRQAIAEALMSDNPEAALADALTRAGRSEMIEAATEALARATGRENSPIRDLYAPR